MDPRQITLLSVATIGASTFYRAITTTEAYTVRSVLGLGAAAILLLGVTEVAPKLGAGLAATAAVSTLAGQAVAGASANTNRPTGRARKR